MHISFKDFGRNMIYWLWWYTCTVWFQNKLGTFFKSHIFHKWENIMNLFGDIYKVWYLGRMWWKCYQNWCLNAAWIWIWFQYCPTIQVVSPGRLPLFCIMGVLFWQIVKKQNYTQVKSMESCWYSMYCSVVSS